MLRTCKKYRSHGSVFACSDRDCPMERWKLRPEEAKAEARLIEREALTGMRAAGDGESRLQAG